MTPGTLARLNVNGLISTTIPIYKRENRTAPSGFINESEVCAVTDESGVYNQVVTIRGEIGWIHGSWLKQA